jgi:hypothetical protein
VPAEIGSGPLLPPPPVVEARGVAVAFGFGWSPSGSFVAVAWGVSVGSGVAVGFGVRYSIG